MPSFSGIIGERRKDPGAFRYDETVQGTVLYLGDADANALDSDPVWRLQRITFITSGQDDAVLEWADGNIAYDNIWDDRLTASYS